MLDKPNRPTHGTSSFPPLLHPWIYSSTLSFLPPASLSPISNGNHPPLPLETQTIQGQGHPKPKLSKKTSIISRLDFLSKPKSKNVTPFQNDRPQFKKSSSLTSPYTSRTDKKFRPSLSNKLSQSLEFGKKTDVTFGSPYQNSVKPRSQHPARL